MSFGFGKFLKVLSGLAVVVEGGKKLWYMVKKDVPRVDCPRCKGSGNEPGDGVPPVAKCNRCGGSGRVRSTDV